MKISGVDIRPGNIIEYEGAVNSMAPGERWWNGTPINPYPLLAGNRAAR